ncbi:MAG: MopE-related protein, partial [Myxococcota bacterium]|nr:MopE-related protein [Myxococcota bacterium]
MLARGRRLLAGWLLPAIAGACSPDEYAILLAVRSQGDVQTLRVTVVPTDGRGRALRSGERPVYRSREDIDEREPLRVAIALDGPRRVLVHLLARDREERAFVATRCYAVGGVVRDRAMLVGPIGPETDVDGDGWPGDASSTCFDPGGPGEPPRPCPDARRCALPAPDCMDCEGCEDIHPGADELCADDVDQDCDGQDAPCTDEDGDGWRRCSATDLPGTCDCDDAVAGIHPDADDPCGDFVDQDCSGADNACDRDGDGFAADVDRGGSPDCDDTDPLIHPDAAEVCTPEGSPTRVDENCNGLVDELLECAPDDLDRDGSPDCSVVEPGVPCDCNDCDPGVRPGTTDRCGDDVDGDCSGADEACPAGDTDRDGHGARASGGPDCDDSNPAIHPGAPEVCGDGTSQSCTADVDCTGDTDGDGYVAPDDCAENDPSRAPRRPDVCNGGDDDCDGVTDEVLHRPTHSASGAPLPHGPTGCVFRNATVPDCASESCPVDLTTNVFHCGRCRYACNPPDRVVANACVDGVCDCTSQPGISACAAGETCCLPAAGCRQLATDFFHCGRCNVPCQATANRCVGGTCRCGARPSCDTGQLCCPPLGAPADAGSCVDPRTDPNHCGTCGNVCGPRMSCIDRRCQCNAPYADCDGNQATGCEIDPTVDLDHCGGCGRRCRRTNATARCTGGVCSIDTCNVGWDDCNRRDDDGCETSLRTLTDCGACGIRCARANATATCATGACRIERCNPGWDDCNRRDDDGCETPLNTLTDCGACGRTCSLPNATATCASGSCRIERCNPGWDNCNGRHDDGCETPLNT